MKIIKMVHAFFYSLTILVLSVLYGGLILSAIIATVAGILRTFGFDAIEMSIWRNFALPVVLSIPVSLLVSFLLIIGSLYIKRSIKFCFSHLKY